MHIIIIGGGPAGYEAALHGAKLGAEITLIEAHKVGGTCLNYGCIPTKTLIEHASFYNKVKSGHDVGVKVDQVSLDYKSVFEHKNEVVTTLVDGIHVKLKKAKVNYVQGHGTVVSSTEVNVMLEDGSVQSITGDSIVLATGSKTMMPQFEGVQSQHILTSKTLLGLKELPKSITIVGGGVIGMEFASLLNDFGVHVHVLEYAKNILPMIDSAISKRLKSICSKSGISITTSAKVTAFRDTEGGIETFYETKKGIESMTSDKVLLSIGRLGSYDESMIDGLGINHNGKFLQVNASYETSLKGVYAIGDVNGMSLLAHAAYDQGRQLMDHLIEGVEIVERGVPGCIFTRPEIGTIGISEDQLKMDGIPYKSQKTLFSASGKALAMGETTGFIKTIVNEEDTLIGVHIMGPHASDIVHYGSIAVAQGMTISDLKNIIFAHPTLGELFSDNIHSY